MSQPAPPSDRILSLDQFRGYTIAGMFLVNAIGGYLAVPRILHHNDTYVSYADVIMPHFLFAVGFAFRLTYLRRIERDGVVEAWKKVVRRSAGLFLIGLAIYGIDAGYDSWNDLRAMTFGAWFMHAFQDHPWQTLVHIGVTTVWVLPVIGRGAMARIAFMIACALANIAIVHTSYFDWVFASRTNEGGPFGFISWTIPLLLGSFAYDAMRAKSPRKAATAMVAWAGVLMVAGYLLSCITAIKYSLMHPGVTTGPMAWLTAAPFVDTTMPRDPWLMLQRPGTMSYQVFCGGFSLLTYAFFVWASDIHKLRVGVFDTLGKNALAAYIIHLSIGDAIFNNVPRDSPLWVISLAFCIFFGLAWFFTSYLNKQGYFLRL